MRFYLYFFPGSHAQIFVHVCWPNDTYVGFFLLIG
jgi:hypothetical protein